MVTWLSSLPDEVAAIAILITALLILIPAYKLYRRYRAWRERWRRRVAVMKRRSKLVLWGGIAIAMTLAGFQGHNERIDQERVRSGAPPVVHAPARPKMSSSECVMPIQDRVSHITSGGMWNAPRDGGSRRHRGLDIWAKSRDGDQGRGTPIRAIRAGHVVYAGDRNGTGWGRLVMLRHKDNTTSLYAHVDTVLVHVGDDVAQGAKIALLGDKGNARGNPHLHLEIGLPGDKLGSRRYDIPQDVLLECGGWAPNWNKKLLRYWR